MAIIGHDGEGLVDLPQIDVLDRPAGLLQRLLHGGTGAVVNRPGSWAWAEWLTIRATMGRPMAFATLSRVITSAAAPSRSRPRRRR
jgi:hypothetical protein